VESTAVFRASVQVNSPTLRPKQMKFLDLRAKLHRTALLEELSYRNVTHNANSTMKALTALLEDNEKRRTGIAASGKMKSFSVLSAATFSS